ncbi:MAG: hypothetical protein RL711_1901, partial [Bacteroidota bacterium]
QWTPLPSANGWQLHTPITDLHRRVICHARHTKNSPNGDWDYFKRSKINDYKAINLFLTLSVTAMMDFKFSGVMTTSVVELSTITKRPFTTLDSGSL